PQNPICHVAAETGAQRALAIFVDEWIRALGVVQTFHQVFKGGPTPIAPDGVDELLSISRRSMEIDHHDNVAVSRKKFGVPAIAPVISPRLLRPAMDEKLYRIFFVGIEVRRL